MCFCYSEKNNIKFGPFCHIFGMMFFSFSLSKTVVTRLYRDLNFRIDKVDSNFIRSLEIRGKSKMT